MANEATQLQLRRGTTAENDAFTGAQGELTYDTEENNIRIHDGQTAGGRRVPLGPSNFSAFCPDMTKSQTISAGTITEDGWVQFEFGVVQNGYATGTINGRNAVKVGSSAYQAYLISGLTPVKAGDVVSGTNLNAIYFYPLLGSAS